MKGKKTGGRLKGSVNKITQSIRELAEPYGKMALNCLIKHTKDKNPSVSIAASMAILDRAYGKPTQSIESQSIVLTATVSPEDAARKAAYMLNHAERRAITSDQPDQADVVLLPDAVTIEHKSH